MGSRPRHSIRARSAPADKCPRNSPRRIGIWVPKRHLAFLIDSLKAAVSRWKRPPILIVHVVSSSFRPAAGEGQP
jgi:hypothetical protein